MEEDNVEVRLDDDGGVRVRLAISQFRGLTEQVFANGGEAKPDLAIFAHGGFHATQRHEPLPEKTLQGLTTDLFNGLGPKGRPPAAESRSRARALGIWNRGVYQGMTDARMIVQECV